MSGEVFLDTSFAIALSSQKDSRHAEAIRIADDLTASNTRLVTTHAVLLELGNALSKQRYRAAATRLLNSLVADDSIEIVPLSEELFSRALHLYSERPDEEWGLTDCMSFVLMTERGITTALTADAHFRQAGFQTLLT